ncbi:PREDICTED: LOC109950838, partial [Prunus dulcis]
MKQATIHAKAEYFNSKHGPANQSRTIFGDPLQASAPTPAKQNHYALILDTQNAQNPKRKNDYPRSFNNG